MRQRWIPWSERITQAKKRGTFTAQDIKDAHDPRKCAVGEQVHRKRIKDYHEFFLKTPFMRGFGSRRVPAGGLFPYCVIHNNFAAARHVLRFIEKEARRIQRERNKEA